MEKTLKNNKENGAVLVEAALYFPLVLCTVMAMIYLGLIHMQANAMLYQVDRIAAEVARTEAYPGYEKFGMNEDRNLDFGWGGSGPSTAEVEAYFAGRHESPAKLYRGIFDIWREDNTAQYEQKYAKAAGEVAIIGIGAIGAPEIALEKSMFDSQVTVTITHRIPVPGVIRYLGIEDDFKMECKVTKSIVNPGEFVRNVDLAVDCMDYLLDKFDTNGTIRGFIEKTQEVLHKIL